MPGPNYTRRVVTGGSLSPSWDPMTGAFNLGIGLDTTLVRTDAARLQVLVDEIDGRDVFSADVNDEVALHTIESVKEVRSLARSTSSTVESYEAREECKRIEGACRLYMRDVKAITVPVVLAAALDALRADTLPSVWVLVSTFGLHPPQRLSATLRDRNRGIALIESWLA